MNDKNIKTDGPPPVDSVRIIETEDGLQWACLDDLIISTHFNREITLEEMNKEIKENGDWDKKEKLIELRTAYNDLVDDFIDALEEMVLTEGDE